MFVPPKATQRNSLYTTTTTPPAAIHEGSRSDGPANYYHRKDHYATSDYQPDEFRFRFGRLNFGKKPVPFPLSNSMFVPPKPQRNSLYATHPPAAIHGYYLGYQPLGLEDDIENFEDGRAKQHRKIMTMPSKIDGSLFHVFPAAKTSSMMTNGGKTWHGMATLMRRSRIKYQHMNHI
ncbi:hypothetical protein PIB30_056100 [Stylosanthes scabra]|uniref:Uncharacterized protein n=1 Tax=Stylosanthes scabra TaxID=79078 RepID=A0ABU6XIA8_9FABA|nr:hypothetical protein [Stylosanthes scabra]